MLSTENIGLKKPGYNDEADIAVINENSDIIDREFGNRYLKFETYSVEQANNAIAQAIEALPNGLVYRGAVNYYKDLPTANNELGDTYSVKYQGETGTTADGNEYAWGEYDGTLQWIKLGVNAYTKDEIDAQREAIESDILSAENDIAINRHTLGTQCKNVISKEISSGTIADVTITVNDDKSITFNGTATKTIYYWVYGVNIHASNQKPLSKGRYILTGCPKGGAGNTYNLVAGYRQSPTADRYAVYDYGDGNNFEIKTDTGSVDILIQILSGTVVDNLTFYPMLRYVGTDSTYEPYKPSVNERLTANENDILRIYQDTQGASLNSVGWYRIFEVNKLSSRRSAIINIARGYGEVAGETITLLLNLVYMDGTTKFADCNVLDKLCRVQYLDKIRVVAPTPYMTSNIAYIDLHYNTTKPNNVNAVILGINSGGKNVTNFTPINLTKINEIGEEYTAIEFDLTGGDIFDRLTALETALSQTTE
jgi:hypothetical protein